MRRTPRPPQNDSLGELGRRATLIERRGECSKKLSMPARSSGELTARDRDDPGDSQSGLLALLEQAQKVANVPCGDDEPLGSREIEDLSVAPAAER